MASACGYRFLSDVTDGGWSLNIYVNFEPFSLILALRLPWVSDVANVIIIASLRMGVSMVFRNINTMPVVITLRRILVSVHVVGAGTNC
jgi:hypothetical protein